MERSARSKPVEVRVLYAEGCANTPATIELIREVARAISIPIEMNKALIETPEQAEEMGFLGSPTVLVNGVDIDLADRRPVYFGLT